MSTKKQSRCPKDLFDVTRSRMKTVSEDGLQQTVIIKVLHRHKFNDTFNDLCVHRITRFDSETGLWNGTETHWTVSNIACSGKTKSTKEVRVISVNPKNHEWVVKSHRVIHVPYMNVIVAGRYTTI